MNNMNFRRKLPIPKDLKAMYPATEQMLAVKDRRAEEIKNIFSGKDNRFILVIGPCSALTIPRPSLTICPALHAFRKRSATKYS